MTTHAPALLSFELGGLTLNCHCTVTRGEPARLGGPPEHCHPGSPDEVELESVFLETEVTEDLGLNAPPRKIEIDITEMLREVQPGSAQRFEANVPLTRNLTPTERGWLRVELQLTAFDALAELVEERMLAQLDSEGFFDSTDDEDPRHDR